MVQSLSLYYKVTLKGQQLLQTISTELPAFRLFSKNEKVLSLKSQSQTVRLSLERKLL